MKRIILYGNLCRPVEQSEEILSETRGGTAGGDCGSYEYGVRMRHMVSGGWEAIWDEAACL